MDQNFRMAEAGVLNNFLTSYLTTSFQDTFSTHYHSPLPNGLGLGECKIPVTIVHQVKEMRFLQASITGKDAFLDIPIWNGLFSKDKVTEDSLIL